MYQSPAPLSVVESLDDRAINSVSVAVDHSDRAEPIDALVGVVRQDDLGPVLSGDAVDAVLQVGAVVADDGLTVALHRV